MGEITEIAWTDSTFNPHIGCAKVAAGCTNCYAESYANRYGKAQWGVDGTRVKTSDSYWKQPIKWNKDAEKAGRRHRVFCASLADVFEDWKGPIHNSKGLKIIATDEKLGRPSMKSGPLTMDHIRKDLFKLIDDTPKLDWLLLTKRPENIVKMWPDDRSRSNVWLLTSVATQGDAVRNIPYLVKCRDLVPVLGVSAEPLIGPLDLNQLWIEDKDAREIDKPVYHVYDSLTGFKAHNGGGHTNPARALDWVIIGGESGPGARTFTIGWAKDIVRACKKNEVPVFVKQMGSNPVNREGERCPTITERKGGDMSEWPEEIRVREFPEVEAVGVR
jgi:protein gp37